MKNLTNTPTDIDQILFYISQLTNIKDLSKILNLVTTKEEEIKKEIVRRLYS